MEDLHLKGTSNSPEVDFISSKGELHVEGRSIPEDPGEFYDRLINWMLEYFKSPCEETVMHVKLEYINSGSSKYMLELLRILKVNHGNGKKVLVKWFFEEGDESIEELGQHYEQTMQIPFEIIEYY